MTEYRPLFQTQLDDTLGPWVNCGLNAIGMATDKDSLGLVRPDASTLRRYLLPDTDGVTQTQALEALEAGLRLDARRPRRGARGPGRAS